MITIYGHTRCGWCTKAKNLAEQYGLEYQWKDTDDQENLNQLKKDLPSVKTVPQIWWDNRYIGGYDKFSAEVENTLGNYGQGTF